MECWRKAQDRSCLSQLLRQCSGTPMPAAPASWSSWCEAKALLKSLHPFHLDISLDTFVSLSPMVTGRERARHVQPFSSYFQNYSLRCKPMQVDRVSLHKFVGGVRGHAGLSKVSVCKVPDRLQHPRGRQEGKLYCKIPDVFPKVFAMDLLWLAVNF